MKARPINKRNEKFTYYIFEGFGLYRAAYKNLYTLEYKDRDSLRWLKTIPSWYGLKQVTLTEAQKQFPDLFP